MIIDLKSKDEQTDMSFSPNLYIDLFIYFW